MSIDGIKRKEQNALKQQECGFQNFMETSEVSQGCHYVGILTILIPKCLAVVQSLRRWCFGLEGGLVWCFFLTNILRS